MYLSKETRASLEQILGKKLEEIAKMDFDEEKQFVEAKTKKPLVFSKNVDPRMSGRGNPLLTRRKIITLQDVDKKILGMK